MTGEASPPPITRPNALATELVLNGSVLFHRPGSCRGGQAEERAERLEQIATSLGQRRPLSSGQEVPISSSAAHQMVFSFSTTVSSRAARCG
jgi:hypothetical protein